MKLNNSGVIFDAASHRYFLGDIELRGITGMIGRQLFPDKYSGVPEKVMRDAAKKGTKVHSVLQFADEFVDYSIPEAQEYKFKIDEFGLRHVASEYTVTDRETFASNIDKVFSSGSETSVVLGDIKNTAKLDIDYLSWQLSIYAYLFELQNPHLSVERLVGIWAKKGFEIVDVPRKPDECVKQLMECEKKGEQYYHQSNSSALPAQYKDMELAIVDTLKQIDLLELRKKEFTDKLLSLMEKNGVKKWETDNVSITYVQGGKINKFNTRKFKEENPVIYDFYITEANRGPYVKITLKNGIQD